MKRADLGELYRGGLISSKPFEYITINDKIQEYKREGKTVSKAVEAVSNLTGKSKRTVYRAMKAAKGIKLD